MEKKKFYLTKEGLEKIKKEYGQLKEIKIAKIKGESPRALHSEDLDSEYLDFQENLDFLDIKIAEFGNVIKNAELIDFYKKGKQDIVDLGATVLVDIDGQKDEFTIVGSLEANPSVGRISNESPVGRALLGRKAGDIVVISSPVKTAYKIKKIKYHLG